MFSNLLNSNGLMQAQTSWCLHLKSALKPHLQIGQMVISVEVFSRQTCFQGRVFLNFGGGWGSRKGNLFWGLDFFFFKFGGRVVGFLFFS